MNSILDHQADFEPRSVASADEPRRIPMPQRNPAWIDYALRGALLTTLAILIICIAVAA